MKICSICHKISATDDNHIDCKEKLRVELEDEDFKNSIPEKLDVAKGGDVGPELKALLDHMIKDKKSAS